MGGGVRVGLKSPRASCVSAEPHRRASSAIADGMPAPETTASARASAAVSGACRNASSVWPWLSRRRLSRRRARAARRAPCRSSAAAAAVGAWTIFFFREGDSAVRTAKAAGERVPDEKKNRKEKFGRACSGGFSVGVRRDCRGWGKKKKQNAKKTGARRLDAASLFFWQCLGARRRRAPRTREGVERRVSPRPCRRYPRNRSSYSGVRRRHAPKSW